MLSFQQRQEAFLFSFIGAIAFLSCAIGLLSCFIMTPQQKAGHSRQIAIHYLDKAEQYSGYNGLYNLSEQTALKAVTLNPFQSANWNILSEILFTMGKDQKAIKAQKIAYMFDRHNYKTHASNVADQYTMLTTQDYTQ